jgi:UDP-sulfoquinovose synthase
MKVFIAGLDGYLGWALAQHLTLRGHTVSGADALLRREWVEEVGGQSAIPIETIGTRLAAFQEVYGKLIDFRHGNLLEYDFVRACLADIQPDAIVHLGEMPSAPYSMIDQAHAFFTQQNNVLGNLNLLWAIKEICPKAHLIKLGTMGEYGTPNVDIPEGFFEVDFRGRTDRLPFPRQAASFYHWSKVHDSNNTMYACNIWKLRSTDIMQGVVFGTRFDGIADDHRLRTRLDYDQCFGTVINRFCCQAVIGHPLTVFGGGLQRRGFIPLRDAMQCLTIACENPPQAGEYRVFNQFEGTYSILELAQHVQAVGNVLGFDVSIQHFDNPRTEAAEHYYQPDRQNLIELGYRPTHDLENEIRTMLVDLLPHREHILQSVETLIPDIRWDGTRQRAERIEPASAVHR